MSRYDPRRYSTPASGDDAADQKAIRDHIRSSALMDEGMCPNGCGPRVPWEEGDGASTCPVCGFWCNRPALTKEGMK